MMPNENRRRTDPDSHQIRVAAEAFVNASINAHSSNSISSSIVHSPSNSIMNDVFIAGNRLDGRMSNVRRFFCLFVTFDLLFTILVWLVCIVITGANVRLALLDQIVHYQITSSLFDIIMAASIRFTLLMLFYALFQFNHWCIIVLSTTFTSAFLLAKVFLYDWSQSTQPVFQVFLILISFVLVWSELWFLDIKVIPQERLAQDWFFGHSSNERTPLLGAHSTVAPTLSENIATGNYYTPMDTPHHSDDENDEESQKKKTNCQFLPASLPLKLAQDTLDEYKRYAPTLLKSSYDLLTSNEWKFEKSTVDGDVISNMIIKRGKKIFKIMGVIDVAADRLVKTLFEDIEISPSWNKTLSEVKRMCTIDEKTDLVYQATGTLGKGAVGPRDYVILRHCGEYKSYNITSGVSVDQYLIPARKNFVRAECGVTFFAAKNWESEENACRCQFIWVLDTNFKGWIPQKVVDLTIHTNLVEFMAALRKHVQGSTRN